MSTRSTYSRAPSQDARGLIEQESGVRTGVAAEVGGEPEAISRADGGEEDTPALEQRPGHGLDFGGRQGWGEGADSSAGSAHGARWGELYWPHR